MLTQKSKKSMYSVYFLVVAFLFIIIFLDVLNFEINFAKLHFKLDNKTLWFIVLITVIITSYFDLPTGCLLGILLFASMFLQRHENFTSSTESNIPNRSDRSKVVDRLLDQIKKQNPDAKLDDNYYNYLYDKYFNDAEMLDELTKKESRKLVSDIKSDYLVTYNLEEEEELKKARSNWSRLGIS